MKTYLELLAIAEATDTNEAWAPVLAIERAAEAARCLPEPEAADCLRLNRLCVACAARELRVEATAATKTHGALCRICLYVLTATEMRWPIRGCGIDGYPSDPKHPYNREGKH